MDSSWSPAGNRPPERYEANDWVILAIGIALLLPLYVVGKLTLSSPIETMTLQADALIESIQISALPALLALFGFFVLWIIASTVIVIGIHEFIHHRVTKARGGNPVYRWSRTLWVKNPSVVNLEVGASRKDTWLAMVAPLVILDTVLGAIILTTGGIVAGTAAVMLLINTGAACGDIYHAIRIARMPQGTEFANEIVDGELKSWVSFPDDADD